MPMRASLCWRWFPDTSWRVDPTPMTTSIRTGHGSPTWCWNCAALADIAGHPGRTRNQLPFGVNLNKWPGTASLIVLKNRRGPLFQEELRKATFRARFTSLHSEAY